MHGQQNIKKKVRGNVSEKSLCASSEQKWNLNTWQATTCFLEDRMHHTFRHENLKSHALSRGVLEEKDF